MGGLQGAGGEENLRWLVQQVQTPQFTDFVRCTVPLFTITGEGVILFGSGVLFEIADHQFLITAAHVTDDAARLAKAHYPVFIHSGAPKAAFVPLGTYRRLSSVQRGLGRDDDPFDLSVARLSPEVAGGMVPHRRFLHLPSLDLFDQQRPESRYAVFGYPKESCTSEEEGQRIGYQPMLYGTKVTQRDLGELRPPRNPEVDYFLDFSRQFGVRVDGEPGAPADPHGMSGCGIWRLILDQAEVGQWSAQDVKLVGIQHGWGERRHFFRGTRVFFAIQMILKTYPELKGPAQISLPALRRLCP